jgi:limonene-1,2-epoxide hydrolase
VCAGVTPAEKIWLRLHESLQQRDAVAASCCFGVDGWWQNVPHPASVGREAIAALLGPILRRSQHVRWDVVTSSFSEHRGWLERVDRFWIDGTEYVVRCNGVYEVEAATGLITEWRDYVDLGEWRSRLAAAGPLNA